MFSLFVVSIDVPDTRVLKHKSGLFSLLRVFLVNSQEITFLRSDLYIIAKVKCLMKVSCPLPTFSTELSW